MWALTSVGQPGDHDAAACSGGDHEARFDDGDDGQALRLGDHMGCKETHHQLAERRRGVGGGEAQPRVCHEAPEGKLRPLSQPALQIADSEILSFSSPGMSLSGPFRLEISVKS